jgi:outer membrane protein assembly factor BamD
MNKLYFVFLIAVVLSSCTPYQKALKSEDIAVKYAAAEEKYNAGKYQKAIRLFEQIAASYRGKPQAEKMFYMYAQSLYKTKQFYTAGYQFESFASGYPKSEKVEEAAFLGALCYSKLSPKYSLDQIDTDKAIEKMQAFIDLYPDSQYLPEANKIAKELREKLEFKAFEIAKQYHTISEAIRDFRAPIVALDNFIADYPGTPYREDAFYYKIEASYKYAVNSVESKVKIRLDETLENYDKFLKQFPESKYREKADKIKENVNKLLPQYSK